MRVIAADDEKIALEGLMSVILEVLPGSDIHGFKNASDVLAFAQQNNCDLAFLDIEMRGMNGIVLAKKLKWLNPNMNIIFTTGYSEYAPDAFALHASGYVMKPITVDKIKEEINYLRHPIIETKNKLKVKTFGNFECYIDNSPLEFRYNKTRELLAYLIDRNGALSTNGEIMAILWEDQAKTNSLSSYLRNLYSDLTHVLEEHGCYDIIVKRKGRIGINPEHIDCDYFDWLNGKAYAINAFKGEYMSQYSWADFSLSVFDKKG